MNEAISFSDFELEEEKAIELATSPLHRHDNRLHVQFYKHAELNAFESRVQGRKIFIEKVYIRILAPANRLNIIEREASEIDKKRFATQYATYLRGEEQLSVGTPLSEMPTLTPVQVMELKALKVDTVEQLAGMPDSTAQILGTGGLELKRRAIRYLDRTSDASAQGERIRALEKQLAELLAAREKEAEARKDAATVTVTAKPLAEAASTAKA